MPIDWIGDDQDIEEFDMEYSVLCKKVERYLSIVDRS
jgi:hypothetical protein